jgi:hypothetical protein
MTGVVFCLLTDVQDPQAQGMTGTLAYAGVITFEFAGVPEGDDDTCTL